MPLAKIALQIPETMWIAEVSSAYPDITFRVMSTQYDDGTATGLFEVEGDGVVQILSQANEATDVTGIELLWKNAEKSVILVETDNPLLLLPVSRVGVPLKTPFIISNGVASWEIFTSHSRLSKLTDEFDDLGITYDIESIQEFDAAGNDSILTPRQREVLSDAFEAGYYDTPRETSLTQVATSLDITKSTCSDILHRAEGKIIERYIDRNLRG
jgi:predicted DNA binding protein